VLAGSELTIVLVALVILVAIVLVMVTLSGSRVTVDSDTMALSGDARARLGVIAGDIDQLDRHSVEWLSADVIQVSWRHRSGWVFVVALLLFPLGLLALLFTVTSYGTIVLVHEGSPSTIRLGGEWSRAAMDAVDSHVAGAASATV
jgi:hypothetical protein